MQSQLTLGPNQQGARHAVPISVSLAEEAKLSRRLLLAAGSGRQGAQLAPRMAVLGPGVHPREWGSLSPPGSELASGKVRSQPEALECADDGAGPLNVLLSSVVLPGRTVCPSDGKSVLI